MISSMSTCGFTFKFGKYTAPVSKSGKCQYCGKKTTRSTTFEMHKGFFNRNPDGTEMSGDEINVILQAKAAEWKANLKVYHNSCRRSLVLDRLRAHNFICSEESDHIKVWFTANHNAVEIDYDRMCAKYNDLKPTSTLGDLVVELMNYKEKVIDKNNTAEIHRDFRVSEEPTKKSGKQFIHGTLYASTLKGHATCHINGIGDTEDKAFINSLKAVVALGEQAKRYLERHYE